jgi:hypothetical protein
MRKEAGAVRAKKEKNGYVDPNRYLGLCSYCKSAPICTYTRDPNRPVCECEEFSAFTYTPVRVPNQKKISLKHFPKKRSTSKGLFQRYRGLCGDCEERVNCVYPKPEGGVWHCEEFRLGMENG